MDKAAIANTLEKIATLLELKNENVFKIRAYTNAARSIETWGGNVADLQNPETLEKIPGIGKGIAAVVKDLATNGKSEAFESLRAEFPDNILELFSLPGLGAKKVKALYEQLGDQLDRAIEGSVRRRARRAIARVRQNDAGET